MRIVGIVQARMGSTRLPGKVLKRVQGVPLLHYQLKRLSRAKQLDHLMVATTTHERDDPIEALCHELGVSVYRGSESDVLQRYAEAARRARADAVVRSTADCPLIDPKLMDEVVSAFRKGSYDYLSNTLDRAVPRGMDVEVFQLAALEKADSETQEPYDREHVTPYLYRNPEIFRLGSFCYRLTVDTPEDFVHVSKAIEAFEDKEPTFTELMAWLHRNPQITS